MRKRDRTGGEKKREKENIRGVKKERERKREREREREQEERKKREKENTKGRKE